MNSPRRKYGNKPVEIDGIKFASMREGRRYVELKLMERGGIIHDLELQPVFKLAVNGKHVARYTADFRYIDFNGFTVVEEVKSPATRKERGYRMAMRLLDALTGIKPVEI